MKKLIKRGTAFGMALLLTFLSFGVKADHVYAEDDEVQEQPKWLEFMEIAYFDDFVYNCENGGTMEYNYTTNTVTLKNASLTSDIGMIFGSTTDMNIVLVGDNYVTNTAVGEAAIYCSGDIHISGNGTLNIKSEEAYGIWSRKTMDFTNCNVNTQTKYFGILTDWLVVNNSNITVKSNNDYAVYAIEDFNMYSGSLSIDAAGEALNVQTANITGGTVSCNSQETGLYSYQLNMSGGKLKVTAPNAIRIISEESGLINLSNVQILLPENGSVYEGDTLDDNYKYATIIESDANPTLENKMAMGNNFATNVEIGTPEPVSENNSSGDSENSQNQDNAQNSGESQNPNVSGNEANPGASDSSSNTQNDNSEKSSDDSKSSKKIKKVLKNFDADKNVNESNLGNLRAIITGETRNSLTVKWNRISKADGYYIYGCRCGKSYKVSDKPIAKIKNSKVTSYTIKNLKKGTYYKYIVVSYRKVNGEIVYDNVSRIVHATTKGGKYGNAKAIKTNVNAITLRKGKSRGVKIKIIKKDKKILNHVPIRYISSNKKVASVNKKGVVKALKKGKCSIYIITQNGVYKKINVIVK